MRQIFCGFEKQHQLVVESANRFIQQPEPGAFIIGGTNLTGKTSLIKRIKRQSDLVEFNYHSERDNLPPFRYFANISVGFSDLDGKPQNITRDDLYEGPGRFKLLPEALNRGVRVIFLDEAWAGHHQAISLVADELVRKYRCKVIFDVVSWGAGREFFDSRANNDFIKKMVPPIFRPGELHLHLLAFHNKALYEGMIAMASTERGRQFETNIAGFFSRDLTYRLVEANEHGDLPRKLSDLLHISSFGRGERLR